jgi:hypothetical protein
MRVGAPGGDVPPAGGGESTPWPKGFGWAQKPYDWLAGQAKDHPAIAGGIGGGIGGFGLGKGMDAWRDSARREKLKNMTFMDRLMLAGNLAFSPTSFADRYM